MMWFGLFVLIALLLGGLFGLGIVGYPGYLLVVWEGMRLETSVWVALAALLLLIIFIFALYFALAGIISVPMDAARIWRNWRAQRAIKRSNDSIIDWLNGDWKRSFKVARRNIHSSNTPVLHCLIAADAALHNKESQAAEQALQDARQYLAQGDASNQREVKFALAVCDARLAYLRQRYDECLQLLQPLLTSKRSQVIKLYHQACIQAQDFDQLERLLPKLKDELSASAWQQVRDQTYAELLKKANSEPDKDQRLADISQIWRRLPRAAQTGFSLPYARALLGCDAFAAAEQVLAKELEAKVDSETLQTYLGVEQINAKNKLQLLEKLKSQNPQQGEIGRACAQICLQMQLWGQAESYLHKLSAEEQDPWAHYALAQLLRSQNNISAAEQHESQALQLCSQQWQPLPDIPQLAERTIPKEEDL